MLGRLPGRITVVFVWQLPPESVIDQMVPERGPVCQQVFLALFA